MKIILLLGTFVFSSCQALSADQASKEVSCKSLDIKVGGIISWKKRDRETKKVKTFTRYSDIGTKWDSNDNFFEKMVIKSDRDVSSVTIIKDDKKIGDYKVQKVEGHEILGFSFKEEVTQKKKPSILKFNIKLKNNKSCTHTVKIKRAESL